jgi:hypothetical protein
MSLDPRSGRRWATGLVLALAVLVGAAVLLAMPYSRKPVDDYVARAEAAGKPVTVRAVIGPDPTPETNGGVDVESAGKWLDEHKGDPDSWTVVGPWNTGDAGRWYDDLTDEQRRDFDAFLADAKPFFDGLAAGLAKPRLRAPAPEGAGRRDFPDVVPRLRVINVLAARSVAATSPDDRLAAAQLLAKLAVHAEPRTLIEVYVASKAMGDATTAVRAALARGDVDAAEWRARLDELLATPWLPRFREAIRLVRVWMLESLRAADFGGPFVASPHDAPTKSWKNLIERVADRIEAFSAGRTTPDDSPAALVRALESSERLESAATDSYPKLAAEIEEVAAAGETASANRMVHGYVAQTAAALARTDAACRLARIALAAAVHRAKHGEFPASPDDLNDAFPDGVPLDPFTDAAFEFERTASGVRIASSGPRTEGRSRGVKTMPDDALVWELKR